MDLRTRRRFFKDSLALAGSGLLLGCRGLPPPLQAGGRVYRVGVLTPEVGAADGSGQYLAAFRQALAERGYVEGPNLAIEYRAARGNDGAELRVLADELAKLGVDVIVARGPQAIRSAMQATTTIPIVMASTSDPVASGFVASLARPGGNVTGLSTITPVLSKKRLELLKEVAPAAARVAVFWNPLVPERAHDYREAEAAAQTLGLRMLSLEVRGREDFERAFRVALEAPVEALLALNDTVVSDNDARIAEFATRHRLPSMYQAAVQARGGGLMAYGPSLADVFPRIASYVDKIIKGAKPADLPVEQPTSFSFVINLKTARAMGLTIPESVLIQATEMIE